MNLQIISNSVHDVFNSLSGHWALVKVEMLDGRLFRKQIFQANAVVVIDLVFTEIKFSDLEVSLTEGFRKYIELSAAQISI